MYLQGLKKKTLKDSPEQDDVVTCLRNKTQMMLLLERQTRPSRKAEKTNSNLTILINSNFLKVKI